MRTFEHFVAKNFRFSKILVCPHGKERRVEAVRKFFGQGKRGSSDAGSEHLVKKALLGFTKIVVCTHGHGGKDKLRQCGHFGDVWAGVSFFRDFLRTSFMNGPKL